MGQISVEIMRLPGSLLAGNQQSSPLVSIIIPLYGRYDFLEHQILEFAHDPFIRDQCEIIYVVDDPSILSQTLSLAEAVFRLTEVPFSVMSYGGNLGFSGANNAGASAARAPNLLFMNSDVIPQIPNWAQSLLSVSVRPDRYPFQRHGSRSSTFVIL